jgi:bisanhydrobacterioruberin hydratase
LGIEMAGIQTGLLFGQYTYDTGLGVKLFDTPLMIGMNWLFLVYVSGNLVRRVGFTGWSSVILASLLMLGYDLVLEQVAPILRMWSWDRGVIPIQNYIAWFITSLGMHTLIKFYSVELSNRLAPALFLIQFFFFLVIMSYHELLS